MYQLKKTLRSRFGLEAFRSGQLEAIESLLAGNDLLVVMPTGAGKSLIYQLASFHYPGLTLVISPLIALMQDQVAQLMERNISAAYINSTLSRDEQRKRLVDLRRGRYQLLYVAPERLKSVGFRQAIENQTIGLLAIDEAHCISQWGHDFRPDYRHIAEARDRLGQPRTVALTATATPMVQEDITHVLGLSNMERLVTGFNRPNLMFTVKYTVGPEAKYRAIQNHIAQDPGPMIIYVGTRREVEEVAIFLQEVLGIEASHYHAGVDGDSRERLQNEFLTGQRSTIVATNAFGMGIDRPDVRSVIHFNMPGTLEAYYQEAGRAGRDGQPAHAVLLYDPADRTLQEFFIDSSEPKRQEMSAIWAYLQLEAQSEIWASEDDISMACGIHRVKVKVALEQMQSAGVLEQLGDVRGQTLIQRNPWDEDEITSAIIRYSQISKQRRSQLGAMIAYAEGDDCRRRRLLDHFGDNSSISVDRCCDNCLGRQPVSGRNTPALTKPAAWSTPDPIMLVILNAVSSLSFAIGKNKLAQMLTGSTAAVMRRFGYDKRLCYGQLSGYRQNDIKDEIANAVGAGYLKAVGGDMPILRLTPLGRELLKASPPVPMDFPKPRPRSKVHTVEQTRRMLVRGMKPENIAIERGLTEGTIYKHLARLISQGEISLSAVINEKTIVQIETAFSRAGGTQWLRPIKNLLPDDIAFGQIKCVIAARDRETDVEATQFWKHDRQTVIRFIGSLPGRLSRSGVVKVLIGSPARQIATYQSNPYYGRLQSKYSRRGLANYIDKLVERGDLNQDAQNCLILPRYGTVPKTEKIDAEHRWKRVVRLGNWGDPESVPELVSALNDSSVNVRRLAASALGKIGDPRAVDALQILLVTESNPQVRQYAVKAIGRCGDSSARPLLETIAEDPNEKDYTCKAAKIALKKLGSVQIESSPADDRPDSIAKFLNRALSHSLQGPWDGGWVLDFHSSFAGNKWQRTKSGELMYRLKYDCDQTVIPILAEKLATLCRQRIPLPSIDRLVPVPPSRKRDFDPVLKVTGALADRLEIPFSQLLAKRRPTSPQKELTTLVQKEANVKGAFRITGPVAGRSFFIVDDLYDSGATMREVVRLFKNEGANKVYVLAITRTIHTDA